MVGTGCVTLSDRQLIIWSWLLGPLWLDDSVKRAGSKSKYTGDVAAGMAS